MSHYIYVNVTKSDFQNTSNPKHLGKRHAACATFGWYHKWKTVADMWKSQHGCLLHSHLSWRSMCHGSSADLLRNSFCPSLHPRQPLGFTPVCCLWDCVLLCLPKWKGLGRIPVRLFLHASQASEWLGKLDKLSSAPPTQEFHMQKLWCLGICIQVVLLLVVQATQSESIAKGALETGKNNWRR